MLTLLGYLIGSAVAGHPLLESLDHELRTDHRQATIELSVRSKRRSRTYLLSQWAVDQNSAIELTAPSRNKGTRLLRRNDDLWTILPGLSSPERVSGHLLRRPLLGSDLSYADLLNSDKLADEYTVVAEKQIPCAQGTCIALSLNAVSTDHSYPIRELIIHPSPLRLLEDQRFAQSGQAIKQFTYTDHRLHQGHIQPFQIDILTEAGRTSTTLKVKTLDLQTPPSEHRFQHRWLEQD